MKYFITLLGSRDDGYKDAYLILNDVNNTLTEDLVNLLQSILEQQTGKVTKVEKQPCAES